MEEKIERVSMYFNGTHCGFKCSYSKETLLRGPTTLFVLWAVTQLTHCLACYTFRNLFVRENDNISDHSGSRRGRLEDRKLCDPRWHYAPTRVDIANKY
jgi:hypothetical protein